jgi:uncharacterized membrane protein
MKLNWRIELPQILLILGMFVLAAVTWRSAPERIPIHWDVHGNVNGYGGKFMGLLFVPLLAAALYPLLLFIPRIDPGRANYREFAGPYAVIRAVILLVMAVIYGITVLVIRGSHMRMDTIVPGLIGVMFIVLGGVFGKVRPNWFVGVRTPWTLSSKLSWTKTHRLAGWVFVLAGFGAVIGAFIDPRIALAALVGGGVGGSLATIVYSYFVWRADPDKLAPAGTQPADD